MNDERKKRFAEDIQAIAKDLQKQETQDTTLVEGDYRVIDGLHVIHGDLLNKHERLVRELSSVCSDKCSTKYLESGLDEIIANQIGKRSLGNVIKAIDNIVAECNVTHTVFIPLAGVTAGSAVLLGEVRLVTGKSALQQVVRILKKNLADKKDGEKILTSRISILKKEFATGCCAIVEVVGEPTRAKEVALEKCEFIVELLRLSSVAIYHRGFKVPFGIEVRGQYIRPSIAAVMTSSDGNVSSSFSLAGQLRPFELSKENIKTMKSLGVFKLAERLVQSKTTSLDEQIIRGVHWFAESQATDDEENELLKLVIVLEMFLNPGSGPGESISGTIGEGVALLLYKDLETRIQVKKLIKKDVYKARSAVTHGGHVKGKVSMPELRNIVFNLVLFMIKNPHGWTSTEDIREYLTNTRLR